MLLHVRALHPLYTCNLYLFPAPEQATFRPRSSSPPRRRASRTQRLRAPVVSMRMPRCVQVRGITLTCLQLSSGSEEPEKHEYEDEAVESNDSFINDEEHSTASGSADGAQLRSACAALRSRRSWQAMQSSCPLCADLRTVLTHLLDLH